MAGWAVALPALHLLKEFPAVENALNGHRSFRWNVDRCARLLTSPSRRKSLDVGNQVGALLRRQGIPRRHVGRYKAALYRVVQILVRRQRPGWRRTALESCCGKVSRFRINPLRIFSVAVALGSMTTDAEPAIELLAAARISSKVAYVTLLRKVAWPISDKHRRYTQRECH